MTFPLLVEISPRDYVYAGLCAYADEYNDAKKGPSMKTFVMKAIGQVGFMEKPIPQPGPNDAIVKTTAALICTSDSHTVGGAIGPRENLTLGHEAVGIVHEVGSNVKLFKPGDRVLVGAITPDWD